MSRASDKIRDLSSAVKQLSQPQRHPALTKRHPRPRVSLSNQEVVTGKLTSAQPAPIMAPMVAIDAAAPSRTPSTHKFGVQTVSACIAGALNHAISFFDTNLCGARPGHSKLESAQSSPRRDLRGLLPGLSPRHSKSAATSPGLAASATDKPSDVFRSESLDASASAMIQATFRGAKGREAVASNRTSSNKSGTETPDLLSGRSSIKGASCMVQAAGHAKSFQRDRESPGTVVIKEGTANERAIYEALQAETLRDFAPSYHGAVERGAITLLRLGNMTAGCSTPCVMDLKLGTRSFVEAEANNSKRRQDLAQKIADLDVAALLPREVRADKWEIDWSTDWCHHCLDAPMHRCTNAPMPRCTNAPVHQCTNA